MRNGCAPDDPDWFAQIGVVADFQQSADAIDPIYFDYLADFFGSRAYDLIPTGQVIDAGASVSLSSDWDAGPLPRLALSNARSVGTPMLFRIWKPPSRYTQSTLPMPSAITIRLVQSRLVSSLIL